MVDNQSDVSDSCDSEGNPIEKPEYKHIKLARLDIENQLAIDKDKYCLIFDKSGQAQIYFNYKSNIKDFHKEIIAVKIGKKRKAEALDILRRGLVYSMKIGDTLVVNCDKVAPDFVNEYTDKFELPWHEILDYEHWHDYKNYIQIVKKEENKDLVGNPGCYIANSKFQIVFLYTYKSDEECRKVAETIPHSDKMRKLIIEEEPLVDGSLNAGNTIRELGKKEQCFV
jgi:hypothetical protein